MKRSRQIRIAGASALLWMLTASGAHARFPAFAEPKAGAPAPSGSAAPVPQAKPVSTQPMGHPEPLPNRSLPSAEVAAGSVLVQIKNPRGLPVAGVAVTLTDRHGAPGPEHPSNRKGTTDRNGEFTFFNLPHGTRNVYRVLANHASAIYSSDPFGLQPTQGQQVVLHVYPATSELANAQVAVRGSIHVKPRRDVFYFQVHYQFLNVGQVTWLPQNISLRLPDEVSKVAFPQMPSELRFESAGPAGLTLHGAVPPGQQDAVFRFEVPNPEQPSASFTLSVPPRVAQMSVLTDAARGMHLDVPGFPPASEAHGQRGERVLITQKVQRGSEPMLSTVTITLYNIPTSGTGSWIALAFAVILMAGGCAMAWSARSRGQPGHQRPGAQLRYARRVLLDELVTLERAKRANQIGPRTHEATRQRLIDALARIELLRREERRKSRTQSARR